jgi:hypothetical protein
MNKFLPILVSLFAALSTAHADQVYTTDFTSAQGFSVGNLDGQNGWALQAFAQVNPSGSGTVSSKGGPFDRNHYTTGFKGNAAGAAPVAGDFNVGDAIGITVDYQFTLPSFGNFGAAQFGIKNTDASTAPQQGFKVEYNDFSTGTVKFFPDRNDSANGDGLLVSASLLGIDNTAADLISDRMRISWYAAYAGGSSWTVTGLSVLNLDTSFAYTYTGPTQTFTYSAGDAFYTQQLALNGNAGFTGTLDAVSLELNVVPEPGTLALFGLGTLVLGMFRRRR